MAHNITEENGVAEAVFALQPAWHGLGQVLDHAPTSAEAIEAAHLNWNVIAADVQAVVPDGEPQPLPGFRANIREDTRKVLGVVTKDYQVVQNHEAFAFLDALVEDHDMRYESAFSLSGGKTVVLLGRLPEVREIADGDKQERYVLFSTSHDGKSGIRVGPTSVRVVCQNTYRLALDGAGKRQIGEISLMHTSNIMERLQQVREAMGLITDAFDKYDLTAEALASYKMTEADWDAFLDTICPIPSAIDPDHTALREKRIRETRASIESVYRDDDRCNLGDIGGTAWSAFNAVTQQVDHLPRKGGNPTAKAEARYRVTQYGTGFNIKTRAFETAKRIAMIAD